MGVHASSVASRTIVNAGVGNSVEIVVITSPPISLPLDNALILITWQLTVTLGAAQTAFTAVLRRGTSTTGTLVNTATPLTTVASTTVQFSGCITDTPGVVGNQQYTLNINANGAAAAGTVNEACIIALCP